MRDANGVTIAKYFYDGEGKRVKKEVVAIGETRRPCLFILRGNW